MRERWYQNDPDDRGTPTSLEAENPLPAPESARPGTLARDGYETLARRPKGAAPGEMRPLEEANRMDDRDGMGAFGPYGW